MKTRDKQMEQGLKDIIRKHHTHSANEICKQIVPQVNSFLGTIPQHDDLTIVVPKIIR